MITTKNQRFVAQELWDAQILFDHPAYRWLCAALPLATQTSFPTPAVLTDWIQQLHPDRAVGFVDTATCQQDPRYYEVFIADTQKVPTRPDNWHDLFGACIWTLFPRSKQALNQRHLSEIALHGSKNRSPLRHQLTLFDECGLLLLHSADMAQIHRGACLRHAQALDGLDALLDEDPQTRRHRDEPARAGLQPQAGDGCDGYRADDAGDADGEGVRPLLAFTGWQGLQEGVKRLHVRQKRHYSSADEKCGSE